MRKEVLSDGSLKALLIIALLVANIAAAHFGHPRSATQPAAYSSQPRFAEAHRDSAASLRLPEAQTP